jgi:hypothetical protein
MSATPPADRISLRQYLAVLGYRPHFVRSADAQHLWSCYRLPWSVWESARLAACTQDDRDYAREQEHRRRYGQRSVKESAGQSVGPHSDKLS